VDSGQESIFQKWVRAPIIMGASPHNWVRALIKWVHAPMMMGAHSLG
jgi:hypothetical protein